MNILIAGYGSIGRRHRENLRTLLPGASVTVLHHGSAHPKHSDTDRHVYSIEEALATGPNVALLTNPSSLHLSLAVPLATAGVDLFIEKPLSDSLDGVTELEALCRRESVIVQIGYNLRFFRPLRDLKSLVESGAIGRPLTVRAEVAQFLPDWRPDTDYRASVTARRAMGGGVLLELSHEIDYLSWILGRIASVQGSARTVSDLEIDVDDTVDIIADFESGVAGRIHLDMVQRNMARSCIIAGTSGTIEADWLTQRVSLFDGVSKEWSIVPMVEQSRNETFVAELEHFFECVETRAEPSVGLAEGIETLAVVDAVRRSASEGRRIFLGRGMGAVQ